MPSSCQANELLQGLRGIAMAPNHMPQWQKKTLLYCTIQAGLYIIIIYIHICVDPEWYEHDEHTIFEDPSDVDQLGLLLHLVPWGIEDHLNFAMMGRWWADGFSNNDMLQRAPAGLTAGTPFVSIISGKALLELLELLELLQPVCLWSSGRTWHMYTCMMIMMYVLWICVYYIYTYIYIIL